MSVVTIVSLWNEEEKTDKEELLEGKK